MTEILTGAALRAELLRIESTLLRAEFEPQPADRYLAAHLAVGQYAALLLAAAPGRRPGRRNLWQVIGEIAPDLGEWAGYFAALQGKREVVAAGATKLVVEREADDLIRDARAFGELVVRRLRRDARGRSRSGRVDWNHPAPELRRAR